MIMTIWTTALLVLLAARTRSLLLAGWAVAFTYLFVDDWFTVHERAGAALGRRFDVSPHLGELVWLLGLATVVGLVVVVLHLRDRGPARAVSAVLVGLAAGLFACGVVVDFLHAEATAPVLDPYVTMIEDGGEIAVMSLVVAFLFGVAFADHRPELRGRWARLAGSVAPATTPERATP